MLVSNGQTLPKKKLAQKVKAKLANKAYVASITEQMQEMPNEWQPNLN